MRLEAISVCAKLSWCRGPTLCLKVFHSVFLCSVINVLAAGVVRSMEGDDPSLTMLKADRLEWRVTDGPDAAYFNGEGWIGHDLNKLWLKGEYERNDGTTEDAELQALYSRAVAPFWDAQLGVREDFKPDPSRSWLALGFHGLAPYWFELDTAFFIGESSRTAFRLEAEYEILITQKLILSPELEVNAYGKNDADTGSGSGLSEAEFGLRLRYELWREFSPYIGVNWRQKYGNTADFAREDGESVSDTSVVIGIRAWF